MKKIADQGPSPRYWLAWLSLGYVAATLLLTLFGHRLHSSVLLGARKDLRDYAVYGFCASLCCNWLPTGRRLKCMMVYSALKWTLERSNLRDLARSGRYTGWAGMKLRLQLIVTEWAAKITARNVHRVLPLYQHVINFLAMMGARWRKDPISLNTLPLDFGKKPHVLEKLVA